MATNGQEESERGLCGRHVKLTWKYAGLSLANMQSADSVSNSSKKHCSLHWRSFGVIKGLVLLEEFPRNPDTAGTPSELVETPFFPNTHKPRWGHIQDICDSQLYGSHFLSMLVKFLRDDIIVKMHLLHGLFCIRWIVSHFRQNSKYKKFIILVPPWHAMENEATPTSTREEKLQSCVFIILIFPSRQLPRIRSDPSFPGVLTNERFRIY